MSRTTRRQFARTLTVAGASLATASLAAQGPKPGEKALSPLGLALAGVVRAQFGPHLSEEEMTQVGRDFQDYAPFVEDFRKFALKNSDEPDFTFAALTGRWP
jgi:hypothetical protein